MRNHTVRLARVPKEDPAQLGPDDLSGAGTLVRRHGKAGILTAAHNIRLKRRRHESLVEMKLHVLINMYPTSARKAGAEGIEIDLRGLKIQGGTKNNGEGPDIAWIQLSPDVAAAIEARSGIFYRLEEDRHPRIAWKGDGDGKSAVIGCFVTGYNLEQERVAFERGERAIIGTTESIGVPVRCWDAENWDYEERTIDQPDDQANERRTYDDRMPRRIREAIPTRLEYRGGLSGGGIWAAFQEIEAQPTDSVHHELVGLVYYQLPRDSNGEMRLVGHGRGSLTRIIDE